MARMTTHQPPAYSSAKTGPLFEKWNALDPSFSADPTGAKAQQLALAQVAPRGTFVAKWNAPNKMTGFYPTGVQFQQGPMSSRPSPEQIAAAIAKFRAGR